MDENAILRCIIQLLLNHPAEWFTFRRAAFPVSHAAADADLIAALVEYRQDLFGISDDRRFKLRPAVAEAIAQNGFVQWQIPSKPEPIRSEGFRSDMHPEIPNGGCYCNVGEYSVLRDFMNGSVPEAALVYSCCWSHICRVRGLHFNDVPEETWREICARRGYLRARQNSRGF